MDKTLYCDECGGTIIGKTIKVKYDLALDADDGYGTYEELFLCEECGSWDKRIEGLSELVDEV